ncbi:MAG: SufD family Fe-S cluster assembly protein [Candidatus Izimaplasma sp.]|nr:SufD family Fe-S cluster assembly protein [Candidatus Izimaplasma bacterium]
MKIPKYIKNHNNVIGFSEKEIDNNSKFDYKNNQLFLYGTDSVYLYLNNFSIDKLRINVKSDSNIKLFFISYNTKITNIDFNINIHDNSVVKLYSNFISGRRTKQNVYREFNLGYKSSLILINNLTYRGEFNLTEFIYLNKEMSNLDIDLLNIGSNDDITHVNQYVYHNAKKTYSQIHNWLISNQSSKLTYNVNGTIKKGKENSNCQQLNKGIILSENGEIKVEPKLFIDEYNVKASHGAAIGQIDENQLFYLLSRGLSEIEAKNLIISGYINPFIKKIKHKRLETQLKTKIRKLI